MYAQFNTLIDAAFDLNSNKATLAAASIIFDGFKFEYKFKNEKRANIVSSILPFFI